MLARLADTADEEFFHAYFERIEVTWLQATIVPGPVGAAIFTCDPPEEGLSEVERRRIRNQFAVLDLANLYGDAAAAALVQYTVTARRDFDSGGGSKAVRWGCLEAASDVDRSGPNEWRAALYRGMASSDWYCDGGFEVDGF